MKPFTFHIASGFNVVEHGVNACKGPLNPETLVYIKRVKPRRHRPGIGFKIDLHTCETCLIYLGIEMRIDYSIF